MLPRNLNLPQLITTWATALDPIVRNQLIQGNLLNNISLINGVNVINHKLGRKQVGYIITDINGIAQVYRSQPFNDLQLTLTSDSDVNVSLWVF